MHTAKDDTIYGTFNTQSGPVHLSCLPEYRRLSGEQAVHTSKGFFTCYLFHVSRNSRLFNDFYERLFVVLFPIALPSIGTTAVLDGQDSNLQNAN
jgi:hypothetical protein